MKLYLIRHGQTMFNRIGRVQGWCDSPLTEEGIAQAKQLGEGLFSIPFVAAYSSSSERTIDTAHCIIGNREIPLSTTKQLKEMCFGTLEGPRNLRPQGVSIIDFFQQGFIASGGENYDILLERILRQLKKIGDANPNGNVLVVTHGGVIAVLGHHLNAKNGNDEEERQKQVIVNPPANCSVTIIEYENEEFKLLSYGDISYRQ